MNRGTLRGKWRKNRGKLKGQWARLTSDDLGQLEAKYDEMVGLFQEKFGYTRHRADKEVSHFLKNYQHKRSKRLPWRSPSAANPWIVGGVVLGLIFTVRVLVRLFADSTNAQDAAESKPTYSSGQ